MNEMDENTELLLPPEAYLNGRPRSSVRPWEMTMADWDDLYLNTDCHYSSSNNTYYYYHFSMLRCLDKEFPTSKVLTVNRVTGAYKWRRPYLGALP